MCHIKRSQSGASLIHPFPYPPRLSLLRLVNNSSSSFLLLSPPLFSFLQSLFSLLFIIVSHQPPTFGRKPQESLLPFSLQVDGLSSTNLFFLSFDHISSTSNHFHILFNYRLSLTASF